MLPTVLGPESIRASSINESSGDNWTRTKVTSVTNITNITSFLAVHNSSLGDLVTHSLTDCQTDWVTFWFWNIRQLKSEPRDLWPLRHLIRVMRIWFGNGHWIKCSCSVSEVAVTLHCSRVCISRKIGSPLNSPLCDSPNCHYSQPGDMELPVTNLNIIWTFELGNETYNWIGN